MHDEPTTLPEALMAGVLAAVLWTAAVAVRAPGAEPVVWLATMGIAAAWLGPILALGAYVSGSGAFGWLRVGLVGALVAVLPVAAMGTLLHAKTHHRPLGAVTFAIVATFMVIGAVAIARRLSVLREVAFRRVGAAESGGGRLLRDGAWKLMVLVAVVAPPLVLVLLVLRGGGPAVHVLGDVVLGVVAGFVGLKLGSAVRRFAGAGAVAWLLASAAATALVSLDVVSAPALRNAAPVPVLAAIWDGTGSG